MTKYQRNIEQLESKACLWWPMFLAEKESSSSVIPLLLGTQSDFLSLLSSRVEKPGQIVDILKKSKFPGNFFLKHLCVLADFGGEQFQRLNAQFSSVFPNSDRGKYYFEFSWDSNTYKYIFKRLPVRGTLNNTALMIDGKGLQAGTPTDDLYEDLIMILLFGSGSVDGSTVEILSKCEIGGLLGKPKELDNYIKQKYIFVSRITGGAQANALGQIAEKHVEEVLKKGLGPKYQVQPKGKITGITQNDGRTLISFDMVASRGGRAVAIEMSFQVTTNSTIERKAGQAADRYRMLKKNKHYLAYIIDGAGNFQRRSAVSTICSNSDCTVAYTEEEFEVLIEFIKSVI